MKAASGNRRIGSSAYTQGENVCKMRRAPGGRRYLGVVEVARTFFGAFFARFGQADGLLAALYAPALAAFAGTQGPALSSAHGAGDGLARSFAVPAARR